MAIYETTLHTPTAREHVWTHLSDFSNVAAWDPGVTSARLLTVGRPQVGSRYRVALRLGPLRLPVRYEVTRLAPMRHLTVESSGRLFHLRDRIDLIPGGDGSTVRYRAELTGRGPLRLADAALRLVLHRAARPAEAGLQRWLDGLDAHRHVPARVEEAA